MNNCFNDTWGHLAPKKNKKYKGKVRVTFTNHSAYGCQAVILDYSGFDGPYFHDTLFEQVPEQIQDTSDYGRVKTKFSEGIWDIPLSFKNYKINFDFESAVKIADSLT
jgi:hypothetical protein